MSCQSLHGIGDDILTELGVVESFSNHKAVKVLIDSADGLARADNGLGRGGFRRCFRVTHYFEEF